MKFVAIAVTAIGLAALSAPALAHHSYATFARDKQQTIVGVVHDFRWSNPHAWLEVDVTNPKGGVTRWSIECNSPNMLGRIGWKANSLKPGDKATVVIHPMKDGGAGGSLISVTLKDGTVLTETAKGL